MITHMRACTRVDFAYAFIYCNESKQLINQYSDTFYIAIIIVNLLFAHLILFFSFL